MDNKALIPAATEDENAALAVNSTPKIKPKP